MTAIIFDGRGFAKKREDELKSFLQSKRLTPRIASVVFAEDQGSMLYTSLKKQAAVRVGVEFSVQEVSLRQSLASIQEQIEIYSGRADIDGVMIQKPMKETWKHINSQSDQRFETWWNMVVSVLDPKKDVDCLTNNNLLKTNKSGWQILPATVKAVLSILAEVRTRYHLLENGLPGFDLKGIKVVVIGRSDIVGQPLYSILKQYGAETSLFGTDLDKTALELADLVVSATGVPGLVKGNMIKPGAVVVDVGAPKGDIDLESVIQRAGLLTPVPGGVGPVTVVSLLENLTELLLK